MKKYIWLLSILLFPFILLSTDNSNFALILKGKNIEKSDPRAALNFYTQAVAKSPEDSSLRSEALYHSGRISQKLGLLQDAQKYLKQAVLTGTGLAHMRDAQNLLWEVNTRLLFSNIETPDSQFITVKRGDTLYRIANSHYTTVEYLKIANGLSSNVIYPGMKIKVPKHKFSVVVNLSFNTLTLKSGNDVIKVYRVATGAPDTPTPEGNFTVKEKLVNPVWYKPGGPVIPFGSPENILGTRWMGFCLKGYGIHGTTDPSSIGKHITRGCIRMTNKDVEQLYALLVPGCEVIVTR
ncbi:hypothetical protein B9J78_04910 [bacterium Unc6]|nr:hypothetical protein [bacterium Unc6]